VISTLDLRAIGPRLGVGSTAIALRVFPHEIPEKEIENVFTSA
jgi:hypothetical protein